MTLSVQTCKEIVAAAQADAPLYRIGDTALDELFDYLGVASRAVYLKQPARAFVAARNRLASEALWDGKANRCINLMRKHGLKKLVALHKDITEVRQGKSEYLQNVASYRISRDAFKLHQRSAWGVCK